MLLLSNASVSTFAGTTAKLRTVPARIGPPTPLAQAQFGGVARFSVVLDNAYSGTPTDIAVGDDVQILAWGALSVDTTKRYRVFSAEPAGGLGLECYRLVIGDRVQR